MSRDGYNFHIPSEVQQKHFFPKELLGPIEIEQPKEEAKLTRKQIREQNNQILAAKLQKDEVKVTLIFTRPQSPRAIALSRMTE